MSARKARKYWLQGLAYANSQVLCRMLAKLAPGKYEIGIEEYDAHTFVPERQMLFKCYWEDAPHQAEHIVATRAYAAARQFAPDPVMIRNKPGLGRIYRAGDGMRFIVNFIKTV